MLLDKREKAGFEKAMKKGKKYESRIQDKIKKVSSGEVFFNVNISNYGEFDAIVADYPLLSFIEIKAYRTNLVWRRARAAANKLRKLCLKVTEDPVAHYHYLSWIPRPRTYDDAHVYLTNLQLLFKKLSMDVVDGWKFRMILIVPDKSYETVLLALKGKPNSNNRPPINLFEGDGPTLIVIPEKRIKEVFG